MENGSIADAVIANRGLNFATPYGGGYGGGGYGREFANDGRQEGVVAREFQKWVILYK